MSRRFNGYEASREGLTFGTLVNGAGVDGLRYDKAHEGGSHEGNECG